MKNLRRFWTVFWINLRMILLEKKRGRASRRYDRYRRRRKLHEEGLANLTVKMAGLRRRKYKLLGLKMDAAVERMYDQLEGRPRDFHAEHERRIRRYAEEQRQYAEAKAEADRQRLVDEAVARVDASEAARLAAKHEGKNGHRQLRIRKRPKKKPKKKRRK